MPRTTICIYVLAHIRTVASSFIPHTPMYSAYAPLPSPRALLYLRHTTHVLYYDLAFKLQGLVDPLPTSGLQLDPPLLDWKPYRCSDRTYLYSCGRQYDTPWPLMAG